MEILLFFPPTSSKRTFCKEYSITNKGDGVKVFEKKLGQILVVGGKLSPGELENALSMQEKSSPHKLLGGILIELGFISKDDLDIALKSQFLYSVEGNKSELELSDDDRIKKMANKYRETDYFEELNELIGVITHKIRNPLSVISAAVEVLHEKVEANDTNERFFKMIFKEINSLEKVAKDLFREFSHK